MRLLSSLIMTNAVLLSACAVGPDFEQPQAQLPEHWEAPITQGVELASKIEDSTIEEQWWKQFNDPILTELIDQAKQANLDARIAALRVAQSRVQRDAIAGSRAPAVAANASYQRQRQSEFGTGTRR